VSPVRLILACVALAAAIVAALLAADLRSWHEAIRDGDLRYSQAPAAASWSASTFLPGGFARGILGLSDDVALRRAARRFVVVRSLGQGFDNGYSESRQRADLEVTLTNLSRSSDRVRDSAADNMLGILAYLDSQQTGPSASAPIDRATAAFQSAVQLDPRNDAAKFNLEWLLYQLAPKGTRSGGVSSSSGPAKNARKGGGGLPGKGY
jgi:hypothetical protein